MWKGSSLTSRFRNCLSNYSSKTEKIDSTKSTSAGNGVLMKELNNDNNMCSVAWPLNESEAGIDLVLIGTSPLFLC